MMFGVDEAAEDGADLISVVLPVYNGERYLEEAIESILAQSHTNLELLLIDDGSTDGSAALMARVTDPRVKIISMATNGGLVAALNAGVEQACGSYIARMDADDIAEPHRLQRQLEHLRLTGTDVCGSAIKLFGQGRERLVQFPESDSDIRFRLLYSSALAHPTVFGKAECFKNIRYVADYPVSEDYHLWCRMACKAIKFSNVKEPLLRYRVHGNQISVKKRKQQFDEGRVIALAYAEQNRALHGLAATLHSVRFGFTEIIRLEEWLRILEAAVPLARRHDVSESQVKEMLLYFSRKVQPMNPVVGIQILRSLRNASVILSLSEKSYIAIQALLFASIDSIAFRTLRRIKS